MNVMLQQITVKCMYKPQFNVINPDQGL